MQIKYEVGEIVYIPAEIISAHIQRDRKVYYRVRMNLMDGTATDDVLETQIAGDPDINKPKEETNATT